MSGICHVPVDRAIAIKRPEFAHKRSFVTCVLQNLNRRFPNAPIVLQSIPAGSGVPDIFLSYNREDQAIARRFADAFKAQGFDVWWDTTLRAGEAYDEVTETALREAKVVVVLWSKKSVASRWVRAEASIGQELKHLAPVKIEACDLPVMFRLVQTAELIHWRGDPDDTAWAAFLSDVRRFVAKDLPASPPPGPAPRKAAPASFSARNPVVIGVALFALAVVALAAFAVMRPPAGAASGGSAPRRTAFFGFAADGNDPAVVAIAKSATGKTFDTLSANGLETASASQTQNIERPAQLARAKDLGAGYALGGDVLRVGDHFEVAIRLDDVQTSTTLFTTTLPGDESQQASLPIQVAERATSALQCYIGAHIGLRPLLRTETDEITRAMKRVCAASDLNEIVEAMRALAPLAPDSPGVQAYLALSLFLVIKQAPADRHAAMRQEIDTALKATLAADPKNGIARVIQAELSIADGKTLADAEKLFLAAGETDRDLFFLNIRYGMFLRSVGRYRDALPYLEASVRQRPFAAGNWATLAHTLASTGQRGKAKELYESNATRQDGLSWSNWISSALFDRAGDPHEILKQVPPTVSGDIADCMKNIVEGVLSRDAKRRANAADHVIACSSPGGSLTPRFAIGPTATLGRIDEAFSIAGRSIDSKAYTFDNSAVLFATGARPMRAAPGFLQLVEKLGLMEYWKAKGTGPDFCETEDVPVCRALKQAAKP